ncbi:putative aconitase [Hypomontagnella monticulosa]|nr:putative aconitase [Hypomontagnella monticulosa]
MLAQAVQRCFASNRRALGMSRRELATATEVSLRIPLSRYEQNEFQDYGEFLNRVNKFKKMVRRPLTYAEKVLSAHTVELDTSTYRRRESQLRLRPRRIACQDATAQMSLIQFISAGLESAAVPTTVHCDHLIVGRNGKEEDLPNALDAHSEVYEFMASACKRYNMGFWKPGAGIIHQIVLENYAYPGGMMVGTDSHTPNAGGMGMVAIGVGGADAVDVMAGLPLELMAPGIIGVKLTGQLTGWATPKDVINKLAGILTVKGATGSIIEFFGPGTETISATGMATICNMGAETGATTSIFPYSQAMSKYLRATHRGELARAAEAVSDELRADEGAEYDRVIEIDLSTLEPQINGPFTPDLATSISEFPEAVNREKWPPKLTAGLIGSCTNSSFEDMNRAANIARQAMEAGLTPQMPLLVSPGSEQVRSTLEASKTMEVFEKLQSTILTNACGPCCGSWDRQGMEKGTRNSIITSYNRNFTGRLDSNPSTHIFLTSPEIVMSKIFSDDLAFDPTKDSLKTPTGKEFRFNPPTNVDLPENGFKDVDHVYTPPPSTGRELVKVQISPSSNRLQLLEPFKPWGGHDYENCLILIKVKGKCTTDHITPAGKWFRFRGHLGNISNNTLIGAVNADNGKVNSVQNLLTGEVGAVPDTARAYQEAGKPWVVIGDHNYGEGSSREHAALQPRYLGGVAIIAKSFARIHETNLKKQGILALKFVDETDYDNIRPSDRISIIGLKDMEPGKTLRLRTASSGEGAKKIWECEVSHTYSMEQIEYFKAGSALNLMVERKRGSEAANT